MSKIYLINGNDRAALDHIGSGAALTESLDGEQTLKFTVLPDDLDKISETTLIEYDGQYYDPATLKRTGNSLAVFAEVSAEHVTYRLNRPEYNVQSLNLGGTYAQVLARVLDGTDFTPGTTPTGTIDTTVIEGVSRREALNTAAELMSGEIEYDGWTVNIVTHRGSSTRVDLMGTGNVSAVEVSENLVTGETVYTVGLIRRGTLNCGDEVRLVFQPFGIDVQTRIISMTRNPYNDADCSITVGARVPEITDTYVDISKKVLYKSDASAVINKYINSAEGRAELETVLSGTFVSQSQLDDYPTYSELNAKIGQYISGQEGTAAIISACSGTYQTIGGMSSYYTKTEANTQISQAVSPIQSEISLSASYGSNTIGSNVRALLQLVANADSSAIEIKANKINFTGFTTFLRPSDVGQYGSTTIDGGRITTGTISADRIDVSDIKVKAIWNFDGDMLIQTSATERGVLTIGLTRDTFAEGDNAVAAYREISTYASRFRFLSPYVTNKFNLCIDLHDGLIYPYSLTSAFGAWRVGTATNPFDRFYGMRYYLGFEDSWGDFHFGYLQAVPGGGLDYVDENGTGHTIV